MSAYYPGAMAYRYFSKIEPERDFRSAELARAFDIETAVALTDAAGAERLRRAVTQGDEKLAKALAYLAEEIASVPRVEKAETP